MDQQKLFGYQAKMLKLSLERNLICVLPTGAGKTEIAIELAKIAVRKFPDRHILFLAPTIALVQQQEHRFQKIFPQDIEIVRAYGGKGFHVPHCERATIVFATPQTVYNRLREGFDWSAFSLLIVDECHHADKLHPYKLVMDHYRKCAGTAKPRVLGLTASPVHGREFSEDKVRQLCASMCCALAACDPSQDAELRRQAPVPTMRTVSPQLHAGTQALADAINIDLPLVARLLLKEAVQHASSCDSMAWALRCDEHDTQALIHPDDFVGHVDALMRRLKDLPLVCCHECANCWGQLLPVSLLVATAASVSHPLTIHARLEDLLEKAPAVVLPRLRKCHAIFAQAVADDVLPAPLQCLVDILHNTNRQCGAGEFSAIVFVTQRKAARLLAGFLRDHPTLSLFVRPHAFIGQASRVDAPEDRMSARKLESVMAQFRAGDVNLLVATTVAEEGLDVPSCRLVVRLDPRFTPIQMIQSRGRARYPNSNFYVIVSCQEEKDHLDKAIEAEQRMKMHLQRAVVQPIHADSLTETMWEVPPPRIEPFFFRRLDRVQVAGPRSHVRGSPPQDHISQLNEYLQKIVRGSKPLPVCFEHERRGPDHDLLWGATCNVVYLHGRSYTAKSVSSGHKTKKEARQDAAEQMLKILRPAIAR